MAFKMKGYDTELTPEQRARLAKINKALGGNSGISEKKYKSLKAEQKALSGK